jgi:hypothetical protein
MKQSDRINGLNIPFSKDGFVDSMALSNEEKLVASNDRFELYIDETTSHFKVLDLVSNEVWESNPSIEDPWETDEMHVITPTALQKQQATLEISYFNDTGSLATVNNYSLSISHPKSVLNEEGYRTYQIKYVEDGFQVFYQIEDVEVDYLYFPKYLSEEVIDSLENSRYIKRLAYTGYDEELGLYSITEYEKMSDVVKEELYEVFYGENGLGYTRERAIEENKQNGYTEEFQKISFGIAVQVLLTDTGVTTSIIQDSIEETDTEKLATVTLYPHFGCAVSKIDGKSTDGYLVVPDGTGAVIEFNNGKFYQQPYAKRLYGNDLGLMPKKMPETQQDIKIPLYGMVKESSAFAAIITSGDTQATLNADVAGRIDSYNKIYTSFNFREKESVTLGSGYQTYGLTLWTEERVKSDFTVDYHFLNGEDASYVGIAKVYQQYLVDQFDFDAIDQTNKTQLTAEIIGAYDRQDFMFGVPYNTIDTLTTFDESQLIVEALKERNVDYISLIYKGMINGGLSSTLNDRFDIVNQLGSKRDYNELITYLDDNNVKLYPDVNVTTTSEYNKLFDQYRYTASRVDGKQSLDFTYDLPTKLPISETPNSLYRDDYVINPLYQQAVLNNFLDDYDGNALSLRHLGGVIGGSYGDDVVYMDEAKELQLSMLLGINEELILNNPNGYALPYADYIVDLPLETTRYAILDYQIPLLQLVLSGKVDYSSISLNMDYERSVEYNFLKTLETGSNLKYTLSYDNSQEMRDTKYNYYISTEYTNWLDRISEQVTLLDEIGIHDGYLIDHEHVKDNVFKVTYSHGLEIVINYNLNAVTYEGKIIDATSYIVLEVE